MADDTALGVLNGHARFDREHATGICGGTARGSQLTEIAHGHGAPATGRASRQ